jgi:uncharacterized SAM-binding protein YcdF (DUF218 family)
MTELYLGYLLKSLFLPPGILLLLWLFGLWMLQRNVFFGRILLWGGLGIAYLLTTPLVSGLLLQQLQTFPALTPEEIRQSPAQAIVVLSAERYRDAPEYGVDTVGNHTLVRIRYAAFLHRETGLPIMVSGGHVFDHEGDSLARVMADSLLQDFGIDSVWLEDESRNTAENASLSHALLLEKGVDTVFLVTHAIHMPRAVAAFERTGLKVIPAPTRFHRFPEGSHALLLLPNAGAVVDSYMALHELVGRLWYALRGRTTATH